MTADRGVIQLAPGETIVIAGPTPLAYHPDNSKKPSRVRVTAPGVYVPPVVPVPPPVPPVTPPPPPTARAIGVYVHTSAYDFAMLDKYATLAGAKPAFAMTYQMFGRSTDGWQWPASVLTEWEKRGITPLLSWQPYDWNGSANDPKYALSRILAGDFDAYIATWVTAAKAYGKPVWIRFAHEMNVTDGSYPWRMGVNGNTPTQYVAAWRKLVKMFRDGGATNVRWIWCPNVTGLQGQYPLMGLYPGDDYVDMVGIDGYNWGTSGEGERGWASFTTVFGGTYDFVRIVAPSKPVYIGEFACSEVGGDKAAWITSAYLTEIPSRLPALVGVTWFDVNGAFDAHWAVGTPPAALTAYRTAAASPGWKGRLP